VKAREIIKMKRNENKTTSKRHYPPFWEKTIPVALGIIVLVIAILLIIIISVALGLFLD